jgi:uncharacterized protein (DUF983 family)
MRAEREPTTAAVRTAALRRALRLRCPQCGEGRLFRRFDRLAERCTACGLVYRREQGAQTGSMYLSAAVTQCFAALVIAAIWILSDWSPVVSTAVALPVVLAFCVGFLPFSQALWVAVEYATDWVNRETWARPRL